tara:strand:+ start:348 stop:1013 length:666 start_codon:yes stop_codon:yes gene_type:complete
MINSVLSQNIDIKLLSIKLEEALNLGSNNKIKNIFLQQSFNKFNKNYQDFRKKYKDAKWSIQPINHDLNKSLVAVNIKSTREINDHIYNLNTKQIVMVETYKNKIKGYKVIEEESILNSQSSPLIIKIESPENVLTGEKYEVNLIIEKPLDNEVTAGGITLLQNENNMNISNNPYGIKPNQSGGLFKYIQAPLQPGNQTISAIITHPEGIYSITKKIKVGL